MGLQNLSFLSFLSFLRPCIYQPQTPESRTQRRAAWAQTCPSPRRRTRAARRSTRTSSTYSCRCSCGRRAAAPRFSARARPPPGSPCVRHLSDAAASCLAGRQPRRRAHILQALRVPATRGNLLTSRWRMRARWLQVCGRAQERERRAARRRRVRGRGRRVPRVPAQGARGQEGAAGADVGDRRARGEGVDAGVDMARLFPTNRQTRLLATSYTTLATNNTRAPPPLHAQPRTRSLADSGAPCPLLLAWLEASRRSWPSLESLRAAGSRALVLSVWPALYEL